MIKPQKYIVFDRDGTLIKHIPYLHDPEFVELLPGVREALVYLKNKGYSLFLHTNQSGVARGYFNLEDVELCNQRMISLLNLGDNVFDTICIATDFPPETISYRKPSPKFGLSLIEKYGILTSDLYYIGDSIVDIETAKNLGCQFLGVNTGEFDLQTALKKREDLQVEVYSNITELIKINF